MPITPHATHATPQRSCTVCRWEQMTPDQKSAYRAAARTRGEARWRRTNPEQAALRDEILGDLVCQPCVCGEADATAYITDYVGRRVKWRCRPCARQEQADWRRRRDAQARDSRAA